MNTGADPSVGRFFGTHPALGRLVVGIVAGLVVGLVLKGVSGILVGEGKVDGVSEAVTEGVATGGHLPPSCKLALLDWGTATDGVGGKTMVGWGLPCLYSVAG